MNKEPLPSFENPPVVETVLGVQFDPLKRFTNAHLGAFWKSLPDEWVSVQDANTIPPVFERFEEAGHWGSAGMQLKFSTDPSARVWIRNEAETQMIQIQNGRLHLNWLGRGGGEYPRYERLRPKFDEAFAALHSFVSHESLGEIKPNQWEVTYINHMPQGTVWQRPQDWGGVFPQLLGDVGSIATVKLESFSSKWHFEIEPQLGRLHVDIHHGKKTQPKPEELLIVNLTARGSIKEGGLTLGEGLDLGREAIVRSFAALTSAKAHEFWKENNDNY